MRELRAWFSTIVATAVIAGMRQLVKVREKERKRGINFREVLQNGS